MRLLADGKIPVPWANGPRTDNYLNRLSVSDGNSVTELVLTPFPRQVWPDLWYVKMMNREVKGILARFSSFMRDLRINIIGVESSTVLQGAYHSSRIALDCRAYSLGDGTHDERRANPEARLTALRDALILKFVHDLRFFAPSFPCISIERDLTLWSLDRAITEAGVVLQETPVSIEQGCFEIPEKEIKRLRNNSRVGDQDGLPQVLVSFDEGSDLLRIGLFFKNHGIIPFALTFDNVPGAIAALSSVLSENDCNVLASRCLSIDEDRMLAWILLRHLGGDQERKQDAIVSSWISEVVMKAEELRRFSPRLTTY